MRPIKILYLLILISCGSPALKQSLKSKEDCNENSIMLENLTDQNKPIPVLYFYNKMGRPEKFDYAKSIALDKEILCKINACVKLNSDTFESIKTHPEYLIILKNNEERSLERYVNNNEQLKELFNCIENNLKMFYPNNNYNDVLNIQNMLFKKE